MRRTVLDFSIRTDARISLAEMRARVEPALGCKLLEGRYHGAPMLMAELLGMRIMFSCWTGLGGVETFQLHGVVDDVRFLDEDSIENDIGAIGIEISQAVIDLLAVRGCGDWRVPSRAELDAEAETADELSRAFHVTEAGPQFDPEDE